MSAETQPTPAPRSDPSPTAEAPRGVEEGGRIAGRIGGRGTRTLLVTASLVVIIAGLRAAAPVLLPLVLALFLTVLSLPLLHGLRGRGCPPALAIGLTVLGVLVLLTALGFLISGTVDEFVRTAPGYVDQLIAKVRVGLAALEARNVPISDWLVLEPIDPRSLVNVLGGILGGTVKGVASALSFVTLVLLTLMFMLAEAAGFPAKLGAALGPRDNLSRYFAVIGKEIQRYLEIKTAIGAATGVLLGIWAAVLGIPFPLLWGLVAFLFNYIPHIGSIAAALPVVLVTLVQYGLGRAVVVALGYLVVNFVVGNLLEPRLMGRQFGLSTLVVFLSLIFWGWLWGPLGMLLSVPLTVVLKIMLENSSGLRWVAVLLGPVPESSSG